MALACIGREHVSASRLNDRTHVHIGQVVAGASPYGDDRAALFQFWRVADAGELGWRVAGEDHGSAAVEIEQHNLECDDRALEALDRRAAAKFVISPDELIRVIDMQRDAGNAVDPLSGALLDRLDILLGE